MHFFRIELAKIQNG